MTDGGGRVRAARNPVNGAPALLLQHWPADARYLLSVAVAEGRITGLYLVGNPGKLTRLDG